MNIGVRRLIGATGIYAVGTFLSRGASLILIPLIGRTVSPDQFGYYDIGMSLATLAVPFATFQLGDSLLRWGLETQGGLARQDAVIKTAATGALIVFGLFTVAVLLAVDHTRLDHLLVMCAVVQAFSLAAYTMAMQTARAVGRSKVIVEASAISAVSQLALVAGVATIGGGSGARILLASALAGILAAAYLSARGGLLRAVSQGSFQTQVWIEQLRYSIPLIPNAISWWAVTYATRIVLVSFSGIAAVGQFGMAARLSTLVAMASNVFAMAWQESLLRASSSAEENMIPALVWREVLMLLSLGVGALALSAEWILAIAAGPAYAASHDYAVPLVYSAALSGVAGLLGSQYLVSGKTGRALATTVMAAVTSLGLTVVLVPYFGPKAAAWSSLFSFLLLALVRYRDVAFELGLQRDGSLTVQALMLSAVLCSLSALGSTTIRAAALVVTLSMLVARLASVGLRRWGPKGTIDGVEL